MSERYGKCPRCLGRGSIYVNTEIAECSRCDGTGFSGDAMLYFKKELDRDWDKIEKPFVYQRKKDTHV